MHLHINAQVTMWLLKQWEMKFVRLYNIYHLL